MILKQRMFRVKPYTKCLDCINTDNLKCKKCMDKLVNEIMTSKDNFNSKQMLKKSPKSRYMLENKYPQQSKSFSVPKPSLKPSSSASSFRNTYTSIPKQFEIHSKYELWMRHVNNKNEQKKQTFQDPSKTMFKLWPTKKRNFLSTLNISHQDKKFHKWQQKFLDRINNSSQRQKVQKQRLTKTSLAKLRV